MALPSLATIPDLESWMGSTVNNTDRAKAILSAASTLVRHHTGRVWVDADGEIEEGVTELELDTVQTVVVMVSERVWTNPRGVRQQAIGPFSESVAEWSTYGLSLTDQEKELLGMGNSSGVPGLSSVRLEAPSLAAGMPRCAAWDYEDEEESGS